ncbi:SufE family protein [Chlamydiifrater phoenicopteri]|uniref:SufE family protein n=1 Tax=Chlamydiifrater phoenicopteri TaxID=2681469 RepID=UPI001BCD4B4C|nr:SufE family protein [Chlamydiifrater phoenicopteri]
MNLKSLKIDGLSCQEKQHLLVSTLNNLPSKEAFYQALIELGREPVVFPSEHKIEQNLVRGCQSNLYLTCQLTENKLIFAASSEALLSLGMTKLFLIAYSEETPQTLFSTPPIFSEKLQFYSSISLGRQQGMNALFLKMKLLAVQAVKDAESSSWVP